MINDFGNAKLMEGYRMNKTSLLGMIDGHLSTDISIRDIRDELKHYISPLTKNNLQIIETGMNVKHLNDMKKIIQQMGVYQNQSDFKKILKALTRANLENFVWQVAISNSIQGKTKQSRDAIVDFILNKGAAFYNRLKNGDWALVEEMEVFVSSKSRHECSWCSKTCKYLQEYLFDGDSYYIYDNNVVGKVNDYREYYGLEKTAKTTIDVKKNPTQWYENLCKSLDELKAKSQGLSRTDIDHILWGYEKFKVDLVRI